MTVVFEDPPYPGRGGRGRGKHAEIAKQLRENPGKWARVDTHVNASNAHKIVSGIRKARMSAYEPAGDFDAVTRTVDGEIRVYAVFLGDGNLP